MATSLMSSVNIPSISSPISIETCQNREQMGTGSGFGLSKTSFLCGNTKKLFSSQSRKVLRIRKFKSLISASSLNHIPKQFREENLKEGLMENYKNVPDSFYGLNPSQMNMFRTEDSPIWRQSKELKEESISSARSYLDSCGGSLSGMLDGSQSSCYMSPRMSTSMYRGRGSRRRNPPDVPSILLDERIVYLGMPIVPQVAELIVAQLMYLEYDDAAKPIYLYINSTGARSPEGQLASDEIDSFAVADMLSFLKCRIYTVNIGCAYGTAAMLLSRGTKGYRFLQPNSFVKLYLPGIYRTNGQTSDIYIEAKELQATTNKFLELLSEGTGKPAEVLREDIRRGKPFEAQEAIDYGIADKVIKSGRIKDKAVKSENPLSDQANQGMPLPRATKMSRERPGGEQAAPFGS